MTMRVTRRKDIPGDQEKSILNKIDTTLRLKSLTNHENEYIRLHDYDRTITKKWISDVHVQETNRNRTKL